MKNIILLISLLGILSSCSNGDLETETQEFVPGEVIVGIKSGININTIFEFINQFDHKVDNVNSLTFTSDMPADSLQYVLEFLNQKTYTNDGIRWKVTGYLHYQTNQITIFPRFFEMENLEYQDDWLISMKELELSEKYYIDLNSGVILFNVPIGKEIEWRNQFKKSNIVSWSELNYIADIELHTD